MYQYSTFLWIGWFSAVSLFAETLVGVALEEGTDRPIPYAEITYRSGKYLGTTDSRGRLELTVDRRSAVLVLRKNGYDSTVVELQDYPDLLDVTFMMRPNVRDLGSATVVSSPVASWENPRQMTVQKLEDAAGMRFDVTEHLSQMPGMSGQKDFSSELFYDGSRSEDVAYHLGQLRIPNMRHLDVGFPGNLSVINPHALEGLELHDHYASGPLGQGLATSVQFQPASATDERFTFRTALGTTLREFYVTGPWLFWDSFIFSARYLDPSMLKNMGEKFFTEFRKRDVSCTDCQIQSSDPFELTAKDFYVRLNGTDSTFNQWSVTGLYADDTYAIRQDTSTTLSEVNSSTIIQGSRSYQLVGVEYNAANGLSWHAGLVRSESSDTLRDTTGFRQLNDDKAFSNFIDGHSESQTTYSLGGDRALGFSPWGAKSGLALLYERHENEYLWPEFNRTQSAELSDNVLQANTRFHWNHDRTRTQLGVGVLGATEAQQVLPTVSLDWERRQQADQQGWRLFGNMAWRADWDAPLRVLSLPLLCAVGPPLKREQVIHSNGSAPVSTALGVITPIRLCPRLRLMLITMNCGNPITHGSAGFPPQPNGARCITLPLESTPLRFMVNMNCPKDLCLGRPTPA